MTNKLSRRSVVFSSAVLPFVVNSFPSFASSTTEPQPFLCQNEDDNICIANGLFPFEKRILIAPNQIFQEYCLNESGSVPLIVGDLVDSHHCPFLVFVSVTDKNAVRYTAIKLKSLDNFEEADISQVLQWITPAPKNTDLPFFQTQDLLTAVFEEKKNLVLVFRNNETKRIKFVVSDFDNEQWISQNIDDFTLDSHSSLSLLPASLFQHQKDTLFLLANDQDQSCTIVSFVDKGDDFRSVLVHTTLENQELFDGNDIFQYQSIQERDNLGLLKGDRFLHPIKYDANEKSALLVRRSDERISLVQLEDAHGNIDFSVIATTDESYDHCDFEWHTFRDFQTANDVIFLKNLDTTEFIALRMGKKSKGLVSFQEVTVSFEGAQISPEASDYLKSFFYENGALAKRSLGVLPVATAETQGIGLKLLIGPDENEESSCWHSSYDLCFQFDQEQNNYTPIELSSEISCAPRHRKKHKKKHHKDPLTEQDSHVMEHTLEFLGILLFGGFVLYKYMMRVIKPEKFPLGPNQTSQYPRRDCDIDYPQMDVTACLRSFELLTQERLAHFIDFYQTNTSAMNALWVQQSQDPKEDTSLKTEDSKYFLSKMADNSEVNWFAYDARGEVNGLVPIYSLKTTLRDPEWRRFQASKESLRCNPLRAYIVEKVLQNANLFDQATLMHMELANACIEAAHKYWQSLEGKMHIFHHPDSDLKTHFLDISTRIDNDPKLNLDKKHIYQEALQGKYTDLLHNSAQHLYLTIVQKQSMPIEVEKRFEQVMSNNKEFWIYRPSNLFLEP